jgi:hypothetical protein
MTTREQIQEWLTEGKRRKATHLVVVCDDFDYTDYPVYVHSTQNVREVFKELGNKDMQRVMEVYSYKRDLESQLNEHRAFHFD